MPLSTYEWVHRQPDDPTCGGPARGGQVGFGRTGQKEPPGARIGIDRPVDCTEVFGDQAARTTAAWAGTSSRRMERHNRRVVVVFPQARGPTTSVAG